MLKYIRAIYIIILIIWRRK